MTNKDCFTFCVKMPDGDWSKAREVAEDYLNKNPIIVEVRKPVLYSQSSNTGCLKKKGEVDSWPILEALNGLK